MPRRFRMLIAIATSAAFGAFASLSNSMESPLTFILNAGFAWAGIMVLAGAIVATPKLGALLGFASGVVASLMYYLSDSVLRQESFTDYFYELSLWIAISVILGPLLGLVGSLICLRGTVGLFAGLVVPLGASLEMIWLPRWPPAEAFGDTGNLQIARIIVWAIAAATVSYVVVRSRRQSVGGPAGTRATHTT